MNVTDILGSKAKEILTEEDLKEINKVFDEEISKRVKDRIDLEIENALNKLDEEHTNQFKILLEAIDADHTAKFNTVIKKIDEDHTNKLQTIIESYEKKLKEELKSFKDTLVNNISNYIDIYLKDAVPDEQINEAVSNIKAREILNNIKTLVSVDPDVISESIKDALEDGKNIIVSTKKELNDVMKENFELKKKIDKLESKIILEEKTKGLSDTKKNFIIKMLSGKSAEEISKNYDYVVEMFEREEEKKKEEMLNEAKKETLSGKISVEGFKQITKDNSKENQKSLNSDIDPHVAEYVKKMI